MNNVPICLGDQIGNYTPLDSALKHGLARAMTFRGCIAGLNLAIRSAGKGYVER